MKILIFNWRCWLNPEMGGAEIFTYENAKRWVRAGHDVTLFTSEFPACKREEVLDGVKIVRAGGKYLVYSRAKKLYRTRFAKEGFDIVIDEINTRPFFTPKFVGHGEKVVALIHQLAREYWLYETPFPISRIGYHYLEDKWLKTYRSIPTITVSNSSKNDLEAEGFRNVHVVPEGLNVEPLEDLPERQNPPVIIYLGRLKKAKRPDHAVRAFTQVRKRCPKAELWIVGDGYFRKSLQSMNVEGTRYFGRLGNAERRELMTKAWVHVNPSVREGFGLNVVEANAFGIPSVAYDVPGLRDSIKDGETGLLVETGNIESLGRSLTRLLEDHVLRIKLGENALEYAGRFSWDKAADEFLRTLAMI